MKKVIIIGICILALLLVAGSYKLNLFTLFNEYEEECYEYKIYRWNETYCNSLMGGGVYKNTNIERPCCNDKPSKSIWGHNGSENIYYWCIALPFNKTFWKFTNECIKYHLVRNV